MEGRLRHHNSFEISWEIENFSLLRKGPGEAYLSPIISVDIFQKSKWQLVLYPKGDTDAPEWVSLYLRRCEDGSRDTIVTVTCLIYICKQDGKLVSNFLDEIPFAKHDQYGWEDFFNESQLATELASWGKDTLHIKCEMEQLERVRKPAVECIATTRVVVETKAETWRIRCPEMYEWNVKRRIIFPEMKLMFEVVLMAPDDAILIDVYKTQEGPSKSRLVKCSITLMNVKGEEYCSRKDSYIYSEVDKGVWNIPSFFTRSMLLAERGNLVKDKEFTLEVKFSTSKHIEESLVDHYIYDKEYDNDRYKAYDAVASLKRDFARFCMSEKYSDVKLKVGDVTVFAHKPILSSRSPVFAAMLDHETTKGDDVVISLLNLDVTTLKLLLQFLYSGRTEVLDFKKTAKLLIAADAYQVPSLRKKCISLMKAIICDINVHPMSMVCDHIGEADLKTFVVKYIKARDRRILVPSVWTDIVEKYEASKKEGEQQTDTPKEDCQDKV